MMNKVTYEVRYGDYEVNFKRVKELDWEHAHSIYDRAVRFAEKHGLTWVIALWDSDGWLIKSETINPTGIVS